MRRKRKFKDIISYVNKGFAELSSWLLSIIMLLLIIDLIGRAISQPLQGVTEIAVFVMVAAVYLSIPYGEEEKNHIRMEIFLLKLPLKLRYLVNLLCYFIASFTILLAVYAISRNAISSYYSKEAVAGTVPLPIYPVKTIIAIGSVFYCLQILINFVEEFKKFGKRS